jgi:signal transduction histidine kinase
MLHAVLGYADLILVEALPESAGKQVRENVGHIQQAGARMNRLIGDLIDLSSVRAGRLTVAREVSDPALTIMEAVDTFRAHALANGVSVRAEVHSSFSAPHDAARLLQVLSNLLSNAIKYTEPGGRIWLTAARDQNEVVFRVKDTGIGISADKLPRVFEMLTHAGHTQDETQTGLGIGLPLVETLVKLHGGRVEAHSDGPAQGSEFIVRLPLP